MLKDENDVLVCMIFNFLVDHEMLLQHELYVTFNYPQRDDK